MTGRHHHHRPRPGLPAVLVCPGRGKPGHGTVRLRSISLRRHGADAVIFWDQREGPPPVTGYRDAGGWKTFEFECPACRRRLKLGERRLVAVVLALAAARGPAPAGPVVVDIAAVERALT